jgi:hypothetical protein
VSTKISNEKSKFANLFVQFLDCGWEEMETEDKVALLLIGGALIQSLFALITLKIHDEKVNHVKQKK